MPSWPGLGVRVRPVLPGVKHERREMDAQTVRGQLEEVTERLATLEAERDVLLALRKGLEGWLALVPQAGARSNGQVALDLTEPRRPSGKPVGSVSLRGVIIPIVQAAGGEPLTAREILVRARAKGADSSAKDPEGVVDLILYTLKKRNGVPVERIGPRKWRWAGGE